MRRRLKVADRVISKNIHPALQHVSVFRTSGRTCARQDSQRMCSHVARLAARLRDGIMSRLDGVVINGDEERRYAGNMNMSFAYVEGESLIMGLKVGSSDPALWLLVRCLALLIYGSSATGLGPVLTLRRSAVPAKVRHSLCKDEIRTHQSAGWASSLSMATLLQG